MPEFTIGEKLLVHLYNFRSINLDDYFNLPWDITQDGISTALRISRAHVSIELKKLKTKEYVREQQVRIHGGKVRRMAYGLTENGLKAAAEVEEKAKNAGIDIRSLMDLKKQDPEELLSNLPESDRNALGIACTFRVPVLAEILPDHDRNSVPADVRGYTTIVPELSKRIISAATPQEIRDWNNYAYSHYDMKGQHSAVADEDFREIEMIYHLLKAERYLDVCKRIQKDLYNIILSDDKGLFEAIRDVPDASIKDRYRLDFLTVRAELALSQNDLKTARETGEKLITMDGGQEIGYACLTECLLLRNRPEEAKEMIVKVNSSGNVLGMIDLASVYIDLDMTDEARVQLEKARELMSANNEAAVCQYFICMARLDVIDGNMSDAERHLSKAFNSTDEVGRRSTRALAKNLGLLVSQELILS